MREEWSQPVHAHRHSNEHDLQSSDPKAGAQAPGAKEYCGNVEVKEKLVGTYIIIVN